MRARSHWSLLSSRLVLLVGVVALTFLASALLGEVQRRRVVQREIRSMATTVTEFEERKGRVADLLNVSASPEFLEREARLRLGLQKPGESVIIVPSVGTSPSSATTTSPVVERPSRVQRWWRYVFKP